jgi:hypothetical protein
MHPPLGWLSYRRSGTGQRMALASRSSAPTSGDTSRSTADLKLRPHEYRGRRSEPRNHWSHHRDLGHYHFGDSDPAADLARPHREAGWEQGCTPARVQASVRSRTSTGKPRLSASRCAPPSSLIEAWLDSLRCEIHSARQVWPNQGMHGTAGDRVRRLTLRIRHRVEYALG